MKVIIAAVLGGALLLQSPPALAVTIDGRLDSEYGAPLSTQVNLTNFGDTPPGFTPFDSLNTAIGSELDEAYGFVSAGTLHLFFSGNLRSYVGEPLIGPDQLEVFIDCAAGGQNPLRSDNPALGWYLRLSQLAGLAFDATIAPDYWLDYTAGGSGTPASAFLAELPAGGGGTGVWLGSTPGGPPGTLKGGTNPFGIQVTIDETNRAGVTAGCGTAAGTGTMTGIEWSIPLAAIGNPTGPIHVCAFVDGRGVEVSNQVLGPLPPSTCSLGSPSGVDFGSIPGQQYFVIDSSTPVQPSTWGRVKTLYRR